jgi:pyruvate/2-oxoglutarate dehydrogenase complex dihydrolipoamide acyltransferase (E2) component
VAQDVIMPKTGMYLEDVRLVEWLASEGSEVQAGDVLFTLETDKITIDVEADASGFLHCLVPADSMVPIGGVVGAIASTREEYEGLAVARTAATAAAASEFEPAQAELFLSYIRSAEVSGAEVPAPATTASAHESRPAGGRGARKISPRARALIAEAGLTPELVEAIPATGPEGRLTDRDVRAFLDNRPGGSAESDRAGQVPEVAVAERIPLRGRRRVIARRMLQSLESSAQLTSILEIDVGPLVEWRSSADPRPSYTAIFVAVCGIALRRHPLLNSRVVGDAIELLADVNVAFAVHADEGVIAPVVRGADRLSLEELDARVAALTDRCRAGTVSLAELDGSTFTLSNSGNAPVDITTAIINPPQAAILWLGRIRERAVVVDGAVVVRPTVQACLTYDHRVIDGVPAAEFLGTVETLCATFPSCLEGR